MTRSLGILVALARVATADPLAEAIAHHEASDVTALRQRASDPSTRCALGVVYLLRDDLTRAAIYLEGCATARIDPEVATYARLAVRRLGARLAMGEYAPIEIVTTPDRRITIDSIPDEYFTTPARIWLPPGPHAITADYKQHAITVRARTFARVEIDLRGNGEILWPDPGRAPHPEVMHANDCAILRHRYPTHPCALLGDDEDELAFAYQGPYGCTLGSQPRVSVMVRRDLLVPILATAEGL
jgi:hypothetical protein